MRKIKGTCKADGSVDISYTYTISHEQLEGRKTALERQAEGIMKDLEALTTRRNEILEEIAAIDTIIYKKNNL
jgi:hypothetical protein